MSKNGTLPLLVSIVTYNEELFLDQCLQSLQAQTVETRIKIFDNASSDRTCEIARRYDVELHVSRDNRGYSFGHNHNLRDELFEMALLLNADVILNSDYLEVLASAFSEVERTGMAGGKLYRMNSEGRRVLEKGWPVLDSTGMFFTPSQRHFDRGSEEPDLGRYECRQLVFGITGAALLCSREMLEDVRIDLQYLDEDFFRLSRGRRPGLAGSTQRLEGSLRASGRGSPFPPRCALASATHFAAHQLPFPEEPLPYGA